MSTATITASYFVAMGHTPDEQIALCHNSGSGDVNYASPVSPWYDCFPAGSGIMGFGQGPFGYGPFGRAWSYNVNAGFGSTPFGSGPFGLGQTRIDAVTTVAACGIYRLGFAARDAAGNTSQTATANETQLSVHIPQPATAPVRPTAYADSVLSLEVIGT